MSLRSLLMNFDGTTGRGEIRHTWNGMSISEQDVVKIGVTPSDYGLTCEVEAPFHGDPPPRSPVGSTWQLWEHEVVELFILGDEHRYTEIELSPHGHFLVLTLKGERQFDRRELPLDFRANISGNRWTGKAFLEAAYLPPNPHALNAFAIHGTGEHRTYLALSPPGGLQPDFHQLAAFIQAPWLSRDTR